jgi:ABC-type phosphate transport system ATPase subunit
MSIENRIKGIEEKIRYLEERINMLIQIADMDKRPFTFLALEYGLTKEKIDKIHDLMDRVSDSIQKGKPMHHNVFENVVYEIVPSRKGDYHFAEEIVKTLNMEGRWEEVYKHMKKSGMNLE